MEKQGNRSQKEDQMIDMFDNLIANLHALGMYEFADALCAHCIRGTKFVPLVDLIAELEVILEEVNNALEEGK
jgi:hypothetical protein